MTIFSNRLGKIGFITPRGVTAEFRVDGFTVNHNNEIYEFVYDDLLDSVFGDILIEVS